MFVLIFNTAPVAFGALGAPVTVLGAVTGLPAATLGAMIGRQLPFMALILPFYVMFAYGGMRSVRALWPVLLVAGGSFAVFQYVASNHIDYSLTDVLASLGSLVVTLGFLRIWRPAPDPEFAISRDAIVREAVTDVPSWQGWLPWIIVSAVVILWTSFGVFKIGQQSIPWPGLDKAISITLYKDKPYGAVWGFQPLASGTGILVAAMITALACGVGPLNFLRAAGRTVGQIWIAVITVCFIVGLAYLMNYAGLAYTLGKGVASVGAAVRVPVAVPGLGRGVPVWQRHVRQRAVRQPSSGRRAAVEPQPRPVRGGQFVGRRNGQDDFAAEHCDGRFGDGAERSARAKCSRAPSRTRSS